MSNEMKPSPDFNESILELLAGRATGDLDAAEQKELERQLAECSDHEFIAAEAVRLDLTAAAIELAELKSMNAEDTTMPDALREKIMMQAGEYFGSDIADSDIEDKAEDVTNASLPYSLPDSRLPPNAGSLADPRAGRVQSGFRYREMLAYLAAAAAVMLMVSGWNPFAQPAPPTEVVAERTVTEKFDDFIASQPDDLVDVNWTPVSQGGVTGKVVWSDKLQTGFMVFNGLAINDPAQKQYQLWIFDTPEDEHPADGGVFDIASSGEVIVPIRAHVPVASAEMFAVTVEKPGGVTVSKREDIPVLAQLASAN